jgi:hypothetical protein
MGHLLAEAKLEFHVDHHHIGPAPDLIVLHYTVGSGKLQGPSVNLTVVPYGGGEWGTMRGDGVISLESRHTLRTPGDDLVYSTFSGVYDAGDEGYEEALDDALASSVRAEVAIRFYTAAKDYRWLNRGQFVGLGARDFGSRTLALRIFRLDE